MSCVYCLVCWGEVSGFLPFLSFDSWLVCYTRVFPCTSTLPIHYPRSQALYIREEKAWYTLLVHAPDLHGNPQKNVLPWRPMHAQAVCARPSPLVYRAWERGYPPNSSHSCGVLQSYSVSSNTSRGRKEGKVGVGRPSAPCPSRALEVCSVTGIRSLLSPTPNVTSTHTHAHTE